MENFPNTSVSSSHTPLETILIEHKGAVEHVSPFKLPAEESAIKKIIE